MQKYIRKDTAHKALPEIVEAEQWAFEVGPEYVKPFFDAQENKSHMRHEMHDICFKCGYEYKAHGWHFGTSVKVCPGMWLIGVVYKGALERYLLTDADFKSKYELYVPEEELPFIETGFLNLRFNLYLGDDHVKKFHDKQESLGLKQSFIGLDINYHDTFFIYENNVYFYFYTTLARDGLLRACGHIFNKIESDTQHMYCYNTDLFNLDFFSHFVEKALVLFENCQKKQ